MKVACPSIEKGVETIAHRRKVRAEQSIVIAQCKMNPGHQTANGTCEKRKGLEVEAEMDMDMDRQDAEKQQAGVHQMVSRPQGSKS